MDSLIRLLLLGALFAGSAQAELLLIPRTAEYTLDGVKLQQLAFADGVTVVTYQSPRGWEYSGSSTKLTLRPPNRAQAEATITKIPLAKPGNFDEESLKKLVDEAIAQVPKGSENVSVVSEEKNPLMIQRKETFLVTLAYTAYGQKMSRSILFLNRGNEQIRSQLTCREADFKELHRAFLASQYTWQQL
ncbi:MAG TPA: hypothetical protein VGW39_09475 [Chthoniobacterales bacterium]|nr:hypothetical protein [Chthoniobacterales bacterium]